MRITKELMERMMVPKVHWNASMSEISNRSGHKKIIQEYLDDIEGNIKKAKGLLLFGSYGSGKSALGSIILKHAALKRHIGAWITCRTIPNLQIKETAFDENQTVYERLLSVPILVLDELILRDDMKYTEHVLEFVVRDRVDSQKSTILTTNLAPNTLK